jgi:hypothetical protein
MADNESDDLILVGVIGRAHGVKGEVKVVPETDDPKRFRRLQGAIAKDRSAERELTFTSVRIQTTGKGLTPIVQIDGVSSSRRGRGAARSRSCMYRRPHFLSRKTSSSCTISSVWTWSTTEGARDRAFEDVLDLPAASTMVVSKRDGTRVTC